MNLLVAVLGSLGDVFPVIGFCRSVREQGHSVAVMTSANFENDVAAAGLQYLELCDMKTAEACQRFYSRSAEGKSRTPEDVEAKAQAKALARSLPERIYSLTQQHSVPGGTVLASLPWFTFGALEIVRKKLAIPTVNIWVNVRDFRYAQPVLPHFLESVEDGLKNFLLTLCFRREIEGARVLRRRLGLPAEPNLVDAWFYAADLNITLFPSWFVPWFKGGRLGNTVMTQFPLYQRAKNEGLPPHLDQFLSEGEPPVVITNASWRTEQADFFQASLRACEALGVRAILLTQPAHLSIEPGPGVITAPYAPLSLMLPRVAAIVHHGGLGTIAASLAAGTPQIVVPWFNDNAHNAAYVTRLGVGLSLSPRRYISQTISVLQRVRSDVEIRKNCDEIARRFDGTPDFSDGIRRMEVLLGQRRKS